VPLAGALAVLAVLAPAGRPTGAGTGKVVIGGARVVTATTLSSAASPSLVGGLVAYTATVRPAPSGGTVAFADGSAPITGCAAQPVDPATGTAACHLTYPGRGRTRSPPPTPGCLARGQRSGGVDPAGGLPGTAAACPGRARPGRGHGVGPAGTAGRRRP